MFSGGPPVVIPPSGSMPIFPLNNPTPSQVPTLFSEFQITQRVARPMRTPRETPPTEPNQTLYIRNIHDKRNPKAVIKELTRLFSQYGKVLQVVARWGIRGQAFVVMSDLETAKLAKQNLHGHVLYDKQIAKDVQYAREQSFLTAEKKGELDQLKERIQQKAAQAPKQFIPKLKVVDTTAPNAILFIQNLSANADKSLLESLFAAYPGFKEVRMVPGKADIAFVEYENEKLSALPKQQLHGYRLDSDHEMKVSFAKK